MKSHYFLRTLLPLALLSLSWSTSQAQAGPNVNMVNPRFNEGLVVEGETATLECEVTGALSNNVIWKRNNVQLENGGISSGTLVVLEFSSDMVGNYTCVADYAEGTLSSRAIVLTLAFFELSSCSPTLDSAQEIIVTEGHPTAVDCADIDTNIPFTSDFLTWEILFGLARSPGTLQPSDLAIPGLNQSLFLTNPRSGEDYRCTVVNPISGARDECYIETRVQDSESLVPSTPVILSPPRDIVAVIGEIVHFECIFASGSNTSSPPIEWIIPSQVSTRLSGERVTVSGVTAENVGTYSCSSNGLNIGNASLSLMESPQITSLLPTNVPVTYGEHLSLSCMAGLDAVQWEWYHEGERIVGASGPTLQASSSVISADSGLYQCIATNRAGSTQSFGTVEVQTISVEFTETLPTYILTYRDSSVILNVSARGAPSPVYQWFNAGASLIESTEGLFDISAEGSLTILNLTDPSVGNTNYTSRVSNSLLDGTPVSEIMDSTTLIAITPTVIVQQLPAPIFEAEENSTVILPCVATFETNEFIQLTITYTWTKNGQVQSVDSEPSRLHSVNDSTGSVFLAGVGRNDEGEYQCHVTTFSGLTLTNAPVVSSQATLLRVIDTVFPRIISLSALSFNTFNIQWVYLGNAALDYTIDIKLASSPAEQPWTTLLQRSYNALTDVNITYGDLMPYTLYEVRVIVRLYTRFDPILGFVPDERLIPGVSQLFRTRADVPEDSPRNVRVVGKTGESNSDIVVSWEPPLNPRGEVINYVIEYRTILELGNTEFTSVVTNDGSLNSYTIKSDLDSTKSTRFQARVAAVTEAGQGPFSELEEGSLEAIVAEPFTSSIGFVMIIVAFALIILVSTAILALIFKRIFKKKQAGRYHVRHSGFFGKDVVDFDSKLNDNAVSTYVGRHKRAFGSSSPASKSEDIDAQLEGESSFGAPGTEYTCTTGTPQLSVASSTSRLPPHAPSYIDPPPFEEAIFRSRTQSAASSGYEFSKQDIDWDDNEQGSSVNGQPSPLPHGVLSPNVNNVEYVYEESDNSIEKPYGEFLLEDNFSDHTQYSHLAPTSLATTHHHHQTHHQQQHHPTTPLSPHGSGPAVSPTMTVGEMVHNRLKSQSPEVEGHQFVGCATNV